jgi:hypothetical protein
VRARDVVTFRLRAHHLAARQPASALLDVAGACGVQNSPPGSTLLALHARVEEVTQDRLDRLTGDTRSLLQTWCMRGSPYFFPTADAPVFTTGVLPGTEPGRLHLVVGVEAALRTLGRGLDELVDLASQEVAAVLPARQLAIEELGREVAAGIAARLPPARRRSWLTEGPWRAGASLGEGVVHFCLRILTLRGLVCLAPRRDNTAPFVLLEEWLGRPLPTVDPGTARAALLRRYLHCYGPSTREDFASWVGVLAGDVDPWWSALEDELAPVDVDGRRAWVLGTDLDSLRSPTEVSGVRLLPPGDPYLQQRDRRTIVDGQHHRAVWRAVGAPGAVLADGAVVGTWRPRKRGRSLTLSVQTFGSPSPTMRRQVRDEAEQVGRLRGASVVEVVFGEPAG